MRAYIAYWLINCSCSSSGILSVPDNVIRPETQMIRRLLLHLILTHMPFYNQLVWFLLFREIIRSLIKISENETAIKIAAMGLQGLCDKGIFYNNSQ